MRTPNEYKHIKAWGVYMGSYRYYITCEQEEAAEDNAPVNAIYKHNGRWKTVDDITDEVLRNTITDYANKF